MSGAEMTTVHTTWTAIAEYTRALSPFSRNDAEVCLRCVEEKHLQFAGVVRNTYSETAVKSTYADLQGILR